jgi:hypothetical protein
LVSIFYFDTQYTLCSKLEVDIAHAKFVIQRGLHRDNGNRHREFLTFEVDQDELPSKPLKQAEQELSGGPLPLATKNASNVQVSRRRSPNLVYRGKPTIDYPAERDWPPGWTQETYKRMSGASVGHLDHCWFPPEGPKHKLRSRLDVLRYLARNR